MTSRFRLALAELLIGEDMDARMTNLVNAQTARIEELEAQVAECQSHNRRLAAKLMERCECDAETEPCEYCRVIRGIPERLHG